jgi:hypothetical protein
MDVTELARPPADGASTPASVPELLQRLSDQATQLAHKEVALAKAELQLKARRAGLGAGMFGAATAFAIYAGGALVAGAIILLARTVTPWLAAVIVAGVLAILAAIAALIGRHQVTQAIPPVPAEAVRSVRQDIEQAKSSMEAGRR